MGPSSVNEVFTPELGSVPSVTKAQRVQLAPNPTTGVTVLRKLPANTDRVIVRNVLGEDVIDVVNPTGDESTLDLTGLPPGIYYAEVEAAQGTICTKIVKL